MCERLHVLVWTVRPKGDHKGRVQKTQKEKKRGTTDVSNLLVQRRMLCACVQCVCALSSPERIGGWERCLGSVRCLLGAAA
jgi:hypothetical protein